MVQDGNKMNKIHNDFPVYLIKNFYNPYLNKNKIINTVLKNKKYCNPSKGYNYPLLDDCDNFFFKLYNRYYNLCKKKFKFTKDLKNSSTCWAYVSDKNYFNEVWHDHVKTSTINSVYYLNIPNNDNATIDFRLNYKQYTYKINNYDLIIFPNYLQHKPHRCYKNDYRISINMEIMCNEPADQIFNSIK